MQAFGFPQRSPRQLVEHNSGRVGSTTAEFDTEAPFSRDRRLLDPKSTRYRTGQGDRHFLIRFRQRRQGQVFESAVDGHATVAPPGNRPGRFDHALSDTGGHAGETNTIFVPFPRDVDLVCRPVRYPQRFDAGCSIRLPIEWLQGSDDLGFHRSRSIHRVGHVDRDPRQNRVQLSGGDLHLDLKSIRRTQSQGSSARERRGLVPQVECLDLQRAIGDLKLCGQVRTLEVIQPELGTLQTAVDLPPFQILPFARGYLQLTFRRYFSVESVDPGLEIFRELLQRQLFGTELSKQVVVAHHVDFEFPCDAALRFKIESDRFSLEPTLLVLRVYFSVSGVEVSQRKTGQFHVDRGSVGFGTVHRLKRDVKVAP